MIHVLVVDDTKNVRLLLTQCLEFEGYTVTTAGNGTEALEILSHQSFDLIFLDVRMPELSGTEVLRQMRKMGVHSPVVMITAFGTVKNAVECTQLGAVAYLQKPFTENKVKQVLEEVLHFKPERSNLDNILSLAEEQIKSSRFADAELLLKNSLSAFFLEPRIYLLLSEAYSGLGETEEAEKCQQLALTLKKK